MEPPTILHEDATLIAVVKPAGIATANVPAGEESVFTSVKRLLADRGGRGDAFVGVVSRLDRPVSGVVVFAKSPAAAADIARQFRDRTVAKVSGGGRDVGRMDRRAPEAAPGSVTPRHPRHGGFCAGDAAGPGARAPGRGVTR